MKKSAYGFTVVEVVIIVIVISILAGIVVLTSTAVQRQSRDNKREASAQVIASALETYHSRYNEYPSVQDIVNTNAQSVVAKLELKNADVLIWPLASSTTTNSVVRATQSPNTTTVIYDANDEDEPMACHLTAGAGCDTYELRWQTEKGETKTIKSSH